jgi:hypothetical protein
MYIIVGTDRASVLSQNHLILSLEKVSTEQTEDRAYCVIPFEKISFSDLPIIDNLKNLHEQFVEEYEKGNYQYCRDATEYLYGKFGGELDSFYDEILKRIS